MTGVVWACYAILAAAIVGYVARILRPGTSLADRMVALDSMLIASVGMLAAFTAHTGRADHTDALLVISLLAFLATVTVARYIERRGT